MGAIARVLFWRYQRGSWQYDILCIVILLFIFLTPRSIFDSRLRDGETGPPESGAVTGTAPEEAEPLAGGGGQTPERSAETRDAS